MLFTSVGLTATPSIISAFKVIITIARTHSSFYLRGCFTTTATEEEETSLEGNSKDDKTSVTVDSFVKEGETRVVFQAQKPALGARERKEVTLNSAKLINDLRALILHPNVTIPLRPDFGGVTDGTRAKDVEKQFGLWPTKLLEGYERQELTQKYWGLDQQLWRNCCTRCARMFGFDIYKRHASLTRGTEGGSRAETLGLKKIGAIGVIEKKEKIEKTFRGHNFPMGIKGNVTSQSLRLWHVAINMARETDLGTRGSGLRHYGSVIALQRKWGKQALGNKLSPAAKTKVKKLCKAHPQPGPCVLLGVVKSHKLVFTKEGEINLYIVSKLGFLSKRQFATACLHALVVGNHGHTGVMARRLKGTEIRKPIVNRD
ncbi:hypothetical protein Tco_1265047 [Tanacetum coccineum]